MLKLSRLNMEIWEPILGYEEYYEVSNTGKVRSKHVRNLGQVLKVWDSGRGYLFCNLYKNGHKYNGYIHKLVAANFVHGYSEGLVVNHKDGNKKNNLWSNLEWITHMENIQHASSMGFILRGSKCNLSKLSEDQVMEIRMFKESKSITDKELGLLYGVDPSVINRIINRKTWKHL